MKITSWVLLKNEKKAKLSENLPQKIVEIYKNVLYERMMTENIKRMAEQMLLYYYKYLKAFFTHYGNPL